MPAWTFWAYARMLDRLDAEEAIEGIARQRMGGGLVEKNRHDQMARELEFRARGRKQQTGSRPKSMDALKALTGITVKEGDEE